MARATTSTRVAKKAPAAKKAAPRKKAAPKPAPFVAPKPPLDNLTEEQAKFLANAVMTHPGGCDEGKQQFIERLGLPKPPPYAQVCVNLALTLDPSEISTEGGRYGSTKVSDEGIARLKALVEGIQVPDGVSIDLDGELRPGSYLSVQGIVR